MLNATVADVIYFGDHLRLRCQATDQPEISVKMPLQNLDHIGSGQSIRLHLPPEHLRVYR